MELRQFLRQLPEISDEALVKWKEYLAKYEKDKMEKFQKIPEGPMTEQERSAIEAFNQAKKFIEKGQIYTDASTPLRSLLSLISACGSRDIEAVKRVHVFLNPIGSGDFDFDSEKAFYNSLRIFRAPMPPKDAKEGDIWVIYTQKNGVVRLDDAHFFVLWKDRWMRFANMGNPHPAILQWHRYIDELRKYLPPIMNGER
jgi:hypothetical protein